MTFNPSFNFHSTKRNTLIIICGPTAVGKTNLAIHLAKKLNTEIVSADSRQFYKELEIGTAKPTTEELSTVKHHLINSLSIFDEYNVGQFEKDALSVLCQIFKNNNHAIMVGGSGLYIRAICYGFDKVPSANKEIRKQIIDQYKKEGIGFLRASLKQLDEVHYSKMDVSNPHRMIRAIEVCLTTGEKYSELRKQENRETKQYIRDFNILKIGLSMDRAALYERINTRVDEMMRQGLLEEVKTIATNIGQQTLNALNTVGYIELLNHLKGEYDIARAIELIKQNTRNYAKRQLTWFKKEKDIAWFSPANKQEVWKYIESKNIQS